MRFAYNIYLIAKFHRQVEIAFWVSIIFVLMGVGIVIQKPDGGKGFTAAVGAIILASAFIPLLSCVVFKVRMIMLLMALEEKGMRFAFKVLGLLIPVVDIFVYLKVTESAAGLIRGAGLQVGFWGVNRADLKMLETVFPHRLSDSIGHHDFSPYVDQFPEFFGKGERSLVITDDMREQIKEEQARSNPINPSSMAQILFDSDDQSTPTRRKFLVIIDADPRSGSRVLEALRTVAGIGVWQQVEISVVLRHAASRILGEAGLLDADKAKQFVSMVRENEGKVYVMPDADAMEVINTHELHENGLKEPDFHMMTADFDGVMRF